MTGRGICWLAVAGLLAAGCGGDEEESAPDAVCGGICDAAARCGVNPYTDTCRSTCVANADLSTISRDGAKALGDCLGGIDCGAFDDDSVWQAKFEGCWQHAKYLVPVTRDARALCASYVEEVFECGGIVSTHDCELNFGMWAPDVLDGVSACFAAPNCDALQACVESVFN
jgi:hypothetical protein